MKLDEMPKSSRRRMPQNTAQKFRRLGIGQMAVVSQDSSNQLRRSAACLFHLHVMVEFQRQEVNFAQGAGQVGFPATQIGQITYGSGGMVRTPGYVESESKRGPIIMANRQRPKTQTRIQRDFLIGLVGLNQSLGFHFGKGDAGASQMILMI